VQIEAASGANFPVFQRTVAYSAVGSNSPRNIAV